MRQYLIILVCALLSACAAGNANFTYAPGVESISVWNGEHIPLEPDWQYLDTTRVSVQGTLWNSYLPVTDTMETMLFTRPSQAGEEVLLISRVLKVHAWSTFIFLGGTKAELGTRLYRHNFYELRAETTNAEYKNYFSILQTAGTAVAASYTAEVWDRLPLDTILVRVMHLRPGTAANTLPAYAKLYPQERFEPLLRIRD